MILCALALGAGLSLYRAAVVPQDSGAESFQSLADGSAVLEMPFRDPSDLKGWRHVTFNGKSSYEILRDESGGTALRASSKDAYSALFKLTDIPVSVKPRLLWEWRVSKFPRHQPGAALEAEGENDFALRICVIFGKNNPFHTEVIQYLWDDRFAEETVTRSPYDANVRMVVVRSAVPPAPGAWVQESRDIEADYKRFFGKMGFERLRAVAVMANSDDTHSESEAWLRNLRIELPQGASLPKARKRSLRYALKKIILGARRVKPKIPHVHVPLKRRPSVQKTAAV